MKKSILLAAIFASLASFGLQADYDTAGGDFAARKAYIDTRKEQATNRAITVKQQQGVKPVSQKAPVLNSNARTNVRTFNSNANF